MTRTPSSAQPSNLPPADASLLTVKETSAYLRIPLPTVYYLVQRGQLPAIQIGGRWRINKRTLDRDILRQGEQPAPRMLIVDDDPAIRCIFEKFLTRFGVEHVTVGTGSDAVAAIASGRFDLMFLDLQLPDMDGDEVFGRALEIQPELPVIVVTGYPDSEMMDRILRKGPVTVVKKPLNLSQVEQTIKIHGIATSTAAKRSNAPKPVSAEATP